MSNPKFSEEDENIIGHLQMMFPQYSRLVFEISVHHPDNRRGSIDQATILQRCIDDLLEMRTFSECQAKTLSGARDSIVIDSDDDLELHLVKSAEKVDNCGLIVLDSDSEIETASSQDQMSDIRVSSVTESVDEPVISYVVGHDYKASKNTANIKTSKQTSAPVGPTNDSKQTNGRSGPSGTTQNHSGIVQTQETPENRVLKADIVTPSTKPGNHVESTSNFVKKATELSTPSSVKNSNPDTVAMSHVGHRDTNSLRNAPQQLPGVSTAYANHSNQTLGLNPSIRTTAPVLKPATFVAGRTDHTHVEKPILKEATFVPPGQSLNVPGLTPNKLAQRPPYASPRPSYASPMPVLRAPIAAQMPPQPVSRAPFAAQMPTQPVSRAPFATPMPSQPISVAPFAAQMHSQPVSRDSIAVQMPSQPLLRTPFATPMSHQPVSNSPFATPMPPQPVTYMPPVPSPYAAPIPQFPGTRTPVASQRQDTYAMMSELRAPILKEATFTGQPNLGLSTQNSPPQPLPVPLPPDRSVEGVGVPNLAPGIGVPGIQAPKSVTNDNTSAKSNSLNKTTSEQKQMTPKASPKTALHSAVHINTTVPSSSCTSTTAKVPDNAQSQATAALPKLYHPDQPSGNAEPQRQNQVINIPDSAGDAVPVEKSIADTLAERLQKECDEVTKLFPDVDPDYVKRLLQENHGSQAVNNVCFALLESKTPYPKLKKTEKTTPKVQPVEVKSKDYFADFKDSVNHIYRSECLGLLQSDFRRIATSDLRKIASYFNNHYAPTKKCILDALKSAGKIDSASYYQASVDHTSTSLTIPVKIVTPVQTGEKGVSRAVLVQARLLRQGRRPGNINDWSNKNKLCPELQAEVDFFNDKIKTDNEEQDYRLALTLNENEYEETGQLIECGCCYGEVAFENMIQCYDGHLFCKECLERYAKEAAFGEGKAKLQCMTDGCDTEYPASQLQKALPAAILAKFEERVKEESINLADLEDLVRCPFCDFAALMDPGDKVFKCQNPSCMKESCRYCQEDWTEHFGIPCSELEKKDETKLRLAFEEKMTKAKIRTCHRCKIGFMKSDGCNKMTCSCGAKMCYICRQPNIDYNHFCRHVRDPGKPCSVCKACSLWTNPEEDDERAVAEIQKQAKEERIKQGFLEEKMIGAPSQPPAKKIKTK